MGRAANSRHAAAAPSRSSLALDTDAFAGLFGSQRGAHNAKRFATLEAFQADDPRREDSDETDFGSQWLSPDNRAFPLWRVSYIAQTGEVYAVRLHPSATSPGERDAVIILGMVPPDASPRSRGLPRYNETVNRLLDEYPKHCGRPGGIQWVERKLREAAAKRVSGQ